MPLTSEQQAERLSGIGSSEIAAVCGLSDYAGPYDVYCQKLQITEPFAGNKFTDFGERLEPVLVDWYREKRSVSLRYPCPTYTHAQHEWVKATPDAIVLDPDEAGLVECKTADWRLAHKWGPEGTDDIPDAYLAQCAWQMAVLDLPWVDVVALVDRDFQVYRVVRNYSFEESLLEIGSRFWHDHVLAKVPPPVDGSEACAQYLNLRHTRPSDQLLAADDEGERLAGELKVIQDGRKELEKSEKEVKNKIRALIGDHRGLATSVGRIYWSPVKDRVTTDWKAVAEEVGADEDLVRKHTQARPQVRRLLPKWDVPKERS